MVAIFLLAVLKQGDLSSELQSALIGEAIGSAAFHKSLADVFLKHGVNIDNVSSQRSLGDKRGLLLMAQSTSHDENQSPVFWQYFVWPEGSQNRVQLLKEAELFSGNTFTEGEAIWRDDSLVFAGSEVTGGNGERAAICVYRYVDGKWKLTQHEEDKREGFAKFSRNAKSVDPSRIRIVTRDWPVHLQEPHVGPLLRYESAWVLKSGIYVHQPTHLTYTPLAEMETLAGFVAKGDRRSFDRRVPTAFQKNLWDNLKKYMEVNSVSNEVHDDTNAFQFGESGPIVTMAMRHGMWTPIRWSEKQSGSSG